MNAENKQEALIQSAGKRGLLILMVALVVVTAVSCSKRGDEEQEGSAARSTTSNASLGEEGASEPTRPGPETLKPKAAFAKLVGRWFREDGGYVLEISEVMSEGKLKAAYFNPRPIHVSQAAAAEEGGSVKVGIELNDVNYPGCLYTLVYNAPLDQLQGTYFQAAIGQTYEVVFVRMPSQ